MATTETAPADAQAPVNQWSFTRLSHYQRCPLSWRFHYIDGEIGQPSAAMIRGSQTHEFAELYARHCHATSRASDYEAGRVLLAGYEDADVRTLCAAFIEDTQFDWSLTVADGDSVERAFEVPLPGGIGVLRGRVDLVLWNAYENALVVTDYKSGHSPWDRPDECPQQLVCYAWAMRQLFPAAESAQCIYRYLGDRRSYDWTLYDPRPDWAVAIARRIAADDRFEATPSPRACAWCDYTHLCPVAQGTPLTTLTCPEEAAEALRQVTAREADLRALRAALNAWVAEYEPITAGGKIAHKVPPACVVERDGELVYDGEYLLAPRVNR
ncbi:MAG TPA: PD-(D/E)XK nuclease family protein, partial [Thermoleophilia bacterium]|nr:PD-(D/E)XK nuclease family protein [Thermoleophilia bacterium]